MINSKLKKLYQEADRCRFCRADKNPLQHILAYGALKPKLMLILVNPTHRNLSSAPGYQGPRFPFIGVRQFWKVLAAGGLINKKITDFLPLKSAWDDKHTEQLQRELIKNKLYLTNVVKCCYSHSAYPKPKVIAEQLKILAEEIRIVKPKKIIAFGALVYKVLTGENIKFSDYWATGHQREVVAENISGLNIPVVPVYFPIGRGNPKKAAAVLNKI